MRIDLDTASPIPIYIQIVEQVRRLIALGALRSGDRLPTVRELAVQCRINRNTAGRAIQELEREGIVRTRVGQGTFVADVTPEIDPTERDSILDSYIDRLLVEARSLGLPLEQLPSRLWRRIDSFRAALATRVVGGVSGPLAGPAAAADGDAADRDPADEHAAGRETADRVTAGRGAAASSTGQGRTSDGWRRTREGGRRKPSRNHT